MTGTGNDRWLSTVGPPHPQLSSFPVTVRAAGSTVWRTHDSRGPWYFSAHPGRFNLASPRGTLNTASDEETALREYLGPDLLGARKIPAALIRGRLLSEIELPVLRLADLRDPMGATFGVSPGDFSGPAPNGYTLFRLWAEAFADAGFDGIVNRSRFGTGPSPECVYLFGPEGTGPLGSIRRTVDAVQVLLSMGPFTIVDPPSSSSIVIDP